MVDSVQTATVEELDGAAGSVGQVREATIRLMAYAKGEGAAVILAGHVTKDGTIAGPKALEHLVDAVINLEGERYAALRLLRASKNRFGSTEEVGVFEMSDAGLREVTDPARAFLAAHDEPAPGSVVAPTLEGSRPLLVEVQGLVSAARYGSPVRRASGLDPNRLSLLVAVLGRRAGIGLAGHDVYANLAGGLTVAEPGLDLPIALALASSLRDRPIRPGTVAIGEVGLLGELRPVAGLERRLREAARLGFERAIVPRPANGSRAPDVPGMELIVVGTLADAIAGTLGRARSTWRGRRRDARLTAPCVPFLVSGRRGEASREPLIRYIRVMGALLGGSIGLVLATTGDGLFNEYDAAGALVALWVVAWGVLGFAVLPYLTIVPATWLIRQVEQLSTAEFVTAVAGLLIGLLMGLLLGLPLAGLPEPFGIWLPLGVSIFLGLGMLGLTVAKRQDLLIAAEAIGLVRRPPPAPDADRRSPYRR